MIKAQVTLTKAEGHRWRSKVTKNKQMVAYNTSSDPIEIGELGSKLKVTVTENVCKNDVKNSPNIQI